MFGRFIEWLDEGPPALTLAAMYLIGAAFFAVVYIVIATLAS